jgi:hypothetical protein
MKKSIQENRDLKPAEILTFTSGKSDFKRKLEETMMITSY